MEGLVIIIWKNIYKKIKTNSVTSSPEKPDQLNHRLNIIDSVLLPSSSDK